MKSDELTWTRRVRPAQIIQRTLRKRVPDDLRQVVGKREEKRSLGTRNPEEAKRRHAEVLSEIEAQWADLRRGTRSLTQREIDGVATLLCSHYVARFGTKGAENVQVALASGSGDKLWGDGNVAALEFWNKTFLEVGYKGRRVHGSIKYQGRDHRNSKEHRLGIDPPSITRINAARFDYACLSGNPEQLLTGRKAKSTLESRQTRRAKQFREYQTRSQIVCLQTF